MASIPFAKLEKLKIIPFQKAEFIKEKGVVQFKGTAGEAFTAMYNPEKLSVNNGLIVVDKKNLGVDIAPTQTLTGANATFNVELFFDGTGTSVSGGIDGLIGAAAAIKALNPDFVTNQIEKFYKTTLYLDGDSHHSHYLQVVWGKGFFFSCQLQSATTNYLMFDRQGNPIRATISASFIQCQDASSSKKPGVLGFLSPDLTKIHEVKAGDTIYNIALKEYDDESFYLKIAETNNLKNYRKLVPGQKLILPPVKEI